jgi:hypothetical protein
MLLVFWDVMLCQVNASLVPDIMKEHGTFILLVPHNPED